MYIFPLKLKTVTYLGIFLILSACSSEQAVTSHVEQGIWRVTLNLGEAELPFFLDLTHSDAGWQGNIINGTEKLPAESIHITKDSFNLQMAIFNSHFRGAIVSPTQVNGIYQDYSRGDDYEIPFQAFWGDSVRFQFPDIEPPRDFSGKWRVVFSPEAETPNPAIGIFEQHGTLIKGTFLTETGDYRYLAGNANGDQMRISAFDGSHAYLFRANLRADTLRGTYYSGTHWKEPWYAVKDEDATLKDPYELTYLKPGYDQLSFTFPNTKGESISLDNPQYQGKVVIVQLMGSWCPNCMDESRFFAELYDRYHEQGLEIIALAYERQPEMEDAVKNIQRLKDRLDIDYDILIAGNSDKIEAAKTLPMLNHVLSFPTAIFLDRSGNIRQIHTGFYGPGTGDHYTRFVEKTTQLLEKLLAETL